MTTRTHVSNGDIFTLLLKNNQVLLSRKLISYDINTPKLHYTLTLTEMVSTPLRAYSKSITLTFSLGDGFRIA